MRRGTTDPMVGGVAVGLSARFGIDVTVVRLLFAVLTIGDASGFALYVLAWLVIPRQGETASIARRALADRRAVALGLATATVLGCVLLALDALGLSFVANLVWPVSFGAAGLVVVWRAASDEEKAFLHQVIEEAPVPGLPDARTRRALVGRIVVGVILVAGGLGGLVATRHPTGATLEAVTSAAVVIAGFLVVFGPWWLALARDLAVERRERVRTEERADMAAAIHDSVLQTLALIQRSSADPREVTRLARAQERELRAWLFEARPPGSFDPSSVTTLAQGVAVIENEVEESHGVPVESVVVGDCALDDGLRALLAAGREAAVNAAAWSGASTVSVFAEVEPSRVSLFVRDRGKGFDPGAVSEDRRGISDSIRARMARHGGTADIRSDAGEGTEVELVMPRPESQ
ncbi:MAG TPA: PspC domain-containing protein [Acidimicrobiales bacterium]|nr:PspC domain-containing protein [Acidimicrobiales bacterium]